MPFVAQAPNGQVLYSQPSGRQLKRLATSHLKRLFMLNEFAQPVKESLTNGGIPRFGESEGFPGFSFGIWETKNSIKTH